MPEEKSKERYFTVYTGDISRFSYVNKRSKHFKSRNDYIWKLIEMDQKGLIAWDGDVRRDKILEELRKISEAVGVKVPVEHFEEVADRAVEIGENVTSEEVVDILIQEGIL